jgi:hypothetical protein
VSRKTRPKLASADGERPYGGSYAADFGPRRAVTHVARNEGVLGSSPSVGLLDLQAFSLLSFGSASTPGLLRMPSLRRDKPRRPSGSPLRDLLLRHRERDRGAHHRTRSGHRPTAATTGPLGSQLPDARKVCRAREDGQRRLQETAPSLSMSEGSRSDGPRSGTQRARTRRGELPTARCKAILAAIRACGERLGFAPLRFPYYASDSIASSMVPSSGAIIGV